MEFTPKTYRRAAERARRRLLHAQCLHDEADLKHGWEYANGMYWRRIESYSRTYSAILKRAIRARVPL